MDDPGPADRAPADAPADTPADTSDTPVDAPVVWLDYVDPASYLVDHRLARWESEAQGRGVERRPFEILPPGRALLDPDDPGWLRYRGEMETEAERLGLELRPPPRVPWSRKAHELALLARERGAFPAVHEALFRAYWAEGRDLGRVDVLVAIAVEHGFDRTEVKAALDVDRWAERVAELREEAERSGVRGVPTLRAGGRTLEGYPPGAKLESFLQG